MANYTNLDGYVFEKQSNVGWGLTLKMSGKAPEVAKRIFDTYEHMLYYVNDYNDSCVPGLCLKVMADGDKNGVYFVSAIGTEGADKAFANDGVVLKLGTDARIIAAEADIKAIEDALGELPEGKTIAQMFIDEKTARENGIKAAIEALDVAEMVEAGKFVSSVSQTDGKVSVEFKAVEASEVLVNKTEGEGGNAFTAETVQGVLEEIQKEYMAADDVLADAMDKAIAAEAKARKDADKAINKAINDKIGTVPADKTVVGMIEDAQAAAEAAATKMEKATDATHLTLSQVTDDKTGAITYTIGESDIASAQGLANEIARADAAEKANAAAITDETADRKAADKTITDQMAADKAELEKAIEDAQAAAEAAIKTEKERADAAEKANAAAIATEAARADAAEKANAAAIAAEKERADAAEKANAAAITDETADRKVAISAETEARKAAISAETKAREEAISAETKAREEAISALTKTHNDDKAELEEAIATISGDAKSYSVATVSGDELKGLGENVLEAYKLVDEDGAKAGEYIKIYKDSALKSVELSGQELVFVYQLADGKENTVKVDVSAFLRESEFADGLQVVEHVVSVKRDAASENFLSVSENGIKVSGVQIAINTAVNAEKERAMAAESALTDAINTEVAAREDAIESLSGTVDTIVDELEQDIEDAKAAAIAASTKIVKDVNAVNLTLASVTAENGSITYTIGQTDIASASGVANAIKAEEDARKAAISAETQAREALSGAMDTKINAEVAAREALSGAMDTKINAEKDRAMAAESALTDAINTEVAAREDADKALSDRLTALESGENSVAKQIETAVTAEKNRAEAVEAELRADVNTVSGKADQNAADIVTERERAMAAESGLSNAISAETEARKVAISGVTAQMAADKAELEKAIEDEISARTDADQALSDRLDAIEAVKITGKDAIVVSAEGATGNKEVSLKLGAQPAENAAGVVLSQDTNGLVAKLQWGTF